MSPVLYRLRCLNCKVLAANLVSMQSWLFLRLSRKSSRASSSAAWMAFRVVKKKQSL